MNISGNSYGIFSDCTLSADVMKYSKIYIRLNINYIIITTFHHNDILERN